MRNLWEEAGKIAVKTGGDITGGFNVGFGKYIPEETKDLLMDFIYWVEDLYDLPITLWVDFRHRHYLMRDHKRAAYRFYWVDYPSVSTFENFDDIPVIELPVRLEKRSREALLKAFAEAITLYFAWLCGMNMHSFVPDGELADAIIRAYYDFRGE